jgi:hypothetical protein
MITSPSRLFNVSTIWIKISHYEVIIHHIPADNNGLDTPKLATFGLRAATYFGQLFVYDFAAMVHQQQCCLQLHLYYHLHTKVNSVRFEHLDGY